MNKRKVKIMDGSTTKIVLVSDVRKTLPFVYKDKAGHVTISKKLIPGRPINDIRGLMISKNLEMEINSERLTWLEAKTKAVNEAAELLSVKDFRLYARIYPSFVQTIKHLVEHGYKHAESKNWIDEFGQDGTWCEELFRSRVDAISKEWYIRHYYLKLYQDSVHVNGSAINVGLPKKCRLIHRHYVG